MVQCLPNLPRFLNQGWKGIWWFLSRWINNSPLLLLPLNLPLSRYRLLIAASAPFRETRLLSTILSSPVWLFSVWCVNAPAGLCLLVFFLSQPLILWLHSQSALSCAVSVCEAAGALTVQQVTDYWDMWHDKYIPCTGKYIKIFWRWFRGIKHSIFHLLVLPHWHLDTHWLIFVYCSEKQLDAVRRTGELLLVTSIESCEDVGKSKPGLVLNHRHSVVCLLFAISFLQFKERKKALGALVSHLLMTFSSHSQFILHSLPSSSSSCCTLF